MKLQQLFVVSIGLLIIVTGCQLSDPDSGGSPAATPLSPGGTGGQEERREHQERNTQGEAVSKDWSYLIP